MKNSNKWWHINPLTPLFVSWWLADHGGKLLVSLGVILIIALIWWLA